MVVVGCLWRGECMFVPYSYLFKISLKRINLCGYLSEIIEIKEGCPADIMNVTKYEKIIPLIYSAIWCELTAGRAV
jgi:hypothetical protein